ncbi:hypothetical protein AVEN_64806-1 [Araneus ventricosus]|uniref:Uncharacterized protein n=1 Tax=Araneus ventricosus TaxID=182803 RepID=A0A4Y2GM55_ARAVE|nr:hypothetical protein AVEN_64806-1 [Araneus ventricosus]
MDDALADFYITLPSNTNMDYFPNNTQSSYRTKLSSPLILRGEWEVALCEICIPRSWFNIGEHNNIYVISMSREEKTIQEKIEYNVSFDYQKAESAQTLWRKVNEAISSHVSQNVIFSFREETNEIALTMNKGFEIYFLQGESSKLLYMLRLANENIVIKDLRKTFRFRTPQESSVHLSFKIIDTNPNNSYEYPIDVTSFLGMDNESLEPKTSNDLFEKINNNIKLLELIEDLVKISYDKARGEVEIQLAKVVEIHFRPELGRTLLTKLGLTGNTIIKDYIKFKVNKLIPINKNDQFLIIVKKYFEKVETLKQHYILFLDVGMYKTEKELFNAFQFVTLKQLQNLHVLINVPAGYTLHLGRGLADLLGFVEKNLVSGSHVGKYPLELNAGISEIFVYSDIVEHHRTGDTFSPLLRIIPCMNEKDRQIVKHYDKLLYFPVKKKFAETIEIELRTSSGDSIIFTTGKTYVILSFRRKPIN